MQKTIPLISVKQIPLFKRTLKKLHKKDKLALNAEIKNLLKKPSTGELKKGDLAGVRVYKFKIAKNLYLLSYLYENNVLTLLSFGSHKNYYKNLKNI